MKTLSVLLIGISSLIGISPVLSQEKEKMTVQERAEMKTAKMTKSLGLNSEQKTKVQEINVAYIAGKDLISDNLEMSREQKEEGYKALGETRKAKLKAVLTAEQFKKFEESEDEKKIEKMEHKKHHDEEE